MTVSIAIVIPTRNRPSEAMNAVKALVAQGAPIDIYLCDNSSSPDPLRQFCADHPTVTYLRPDAEVAMGRNWDWAVREAMDRSSATHFSVHYDRKLSKPGVWADLAALAKARPDLLHSFSVDHIGHVPPPLRLWQAQWTGRPFAISTQRVSALVAAGRMPEIAPALPILSNCLVPRPILERVLERFGTVCDSIGPDAAFMARFFALEDTYVHYDRPLGILYSSLRSTGLGYMRGKGGDFADFFRLSGAEGWLAAAPIPGMNVGYNMLYHEYELVRRATGDRLPAFDRAAILDDLARELRWMADPAMAAEFRSVLRREGWNGTDPEPLPAQTPAEAAYQKRMQRRMRWLRQVPPTITGFAFKNDREALKWALRYPRQREEDCPHLDVLEPTAIEPGAA